MLKVPKLQSLVQVFIVPASTPPPEAAIAPMSMGVIEEITIGAWVGGRAPEVSILRCDATAVERRMASSGVKSESRICISSA